MMKHAFDHYTFVSASCIALLAFFLVFVAVFLWAFRKGSKEVYQYASDLPLLDDGDDHE